jgi:hypothetical protein
VRSLKRATQRRRVSKRRVTRGAAAARAASLSAMFTEWEARAGAADRYLTVAEKLMVKHRLDRLRGEIAWHQELAEQLPKIITDEQTRGG